MDQQSAWEKEYAITKGVTTSYVDEPSAEVTWLMDYMRHHGLRPGGRAIDLGCGGGRNALYLARHGYNVVATDFAEPALDKLRRAVSHTETEKHIEVVQADLTSPLPWADNSFDLALDMTANASLGWDQLLQFESEIRRIVKPGGLVLCQAIADDDGVLRALNPNGRSVTVAESGITDHYWNESELRQVYKEWDILVMERGEGLGQFYGKTYDRKYWKLLVRKP